MHKPLEDKTFHSEKKIFRERQRENLEFNFCWSIILFFLINSFNHNEELHKTIKSLDKPGF